MWLLHFTFVLLSVSSWFRVSILSVLYMYLFLPFFVPGRASDLVSRPTVAHKYAWRRCQLSMVKVLLFRPA